MQQKNPVLTGFHPDPCICRRGDAYYIAVSGFSWFPGIPLYRSFDLRRWDLYAHVLPDEKACGETLPAGAGVRVSSLTWCEEDSLVCVVYGIWHAGENGCRDVSSYLVTAEDLRGPWSEPVYLYTQSSGASLFHDRDGRRWLVSVEPGDGTGQGGAVCITEYDPVTKTNTGNPMRIMETAAAFGSPEAVHLSRQGERYYLMCAQAGPGDSYCVTMARAERLEGPYEGDPKNPILTSSPLEQRGGRAADPGSRPILGHAEYVETGAGEIYLVHPCGRPFEPEKCCALGGETALERMSRTEDGWIRLSWGGNLAQPYTEGSAMPSREIRPCPETDDFETEIPGIGYYAPHTGPESFCDRSSRPGWLRMRGQEELLSAGRVSILARKLKSIHAEAVTRMDFSPETSRHSAGLVLYCDHINYAYLCKTYSEEERRPVLVLVRVNNGKRLAYRATEEQLPEGPLWLKVHVRGREVCFFYSYDGNGWEEAGPVFDASEFSAEYSYLAGPGGCFVCLACEDRLRHSRCADFDFLCLRDLEPELSPGARVSNRTGIHADRQQKLMRRKAQSLAADLHENEMSHNSYEQERREQECIRRGDLEGLYRSVAELEMERVGMLARDSLRNGKDLAITAIALSSRSAIEGGVSPETAFSMSDSFVQQVERLWDEEKVLKFARRAQVEFCLAVRDSIHSDTTNPTVRRCRDFVSRRVYTKVTVEEIAGAMNINPSYLSQLFAREEGMPLSEYIAREKVRAAAQELVFTEKSFDAVAASLCFSSQSHFGKVFKKWTGMTPGQYRTIYGEQTNEY